MKVMIDGQECIVKWQHKNYSKRYFSYHLNKDITGETICAIRGPQIILDGSAYCLVEDQYNKNIGRKRSMARALKVLKRPVRKLFWTAYEAEMGLQ